MRAAGEAMTEQGDEPRLLRPQGVLRVKDQGKTPTDDTGTPERRLPVLDQGFMALEDWMGGDAAVVRGAADENQAFRLGLEAFCRARGDVGRNAKSLPKPANDRGARGRLTP